MGNKNGGARCYSQRFIDYEFALSMMFAEGRGSRRTRMSMGEWAVALILLAICVVVIATMLVVCRLLGVWSFTSLFTSSDEKAALKDNEHFGGYSVS